ncbi:MAG TPA: hypothetical protein DCQ36_05590 [Actinobacteria bacterium]|jgi:hypothetical protein|nr:hypothetical protein [Actinomycetota bacterium]
MPLDPPLDAQAVVAHDRACARGEAGYADPRTGLFVFTRDYLSNRGWCCGHACRHCPYDHIAVPRPRP